MPDRSAAAGRRSAALSTALLDELRVMTNLVRGGVAASAAGAGRLRRRSKKVSPIRSLESFSQRLSARCYLAPFSREETAQFVRAQVAAAGATPDDVFAADACDAVFDATDGVPRLVNQVVRSRPDCWLKRRESHAHRPAGDSSRVGRSAATADAVGARSGIVDARADISQVDRIRTACDDESVAIGQMSSSRLS